MLILACISVTPEVASIPICTALDSTTLVLSVYIFAWSERLVLSVLGNAWSEQLVM